MKAFPIVIDRESQIANDTNFAVQEDGMDLRDYFAAKAMQSLLTHEWLYLYDKAEKMGFEDWDDYVVETSYFVADKMMKARG